MEQEKTIEQEKQDTFIPYSNCPVSQTIILGSPSYLPPTTSRAFIPTTRPLSNRETRRLTFEYLKQIWCLDTNALTIAKEKRRLFRGITQKEQELLDLHENKCQPQNRWNNKSPFKRQRRN